MGKAIVLAHGLFMQKPIMFYLKNKFKENGFNVYNYNYNTIKFNEETLNDFDDFVKQVNEEEVYFIGHSMGGLLMRLYFQNFKPQFKDSCLITLGTPHKGSSFGDFIKESKIGFIMGSASNSGVTKGLDDIWTGDYPIGCVIGVLNIGPNNIFNKEQHAGDGTVLKTEAFVNNATDITELNVNHTGMIYSKKVVDECLYFIENKRFKKDISKEDSFNFSIEKMKEALSSGRKKVSELKNFKDFEDWLKK